MSACMLLSIRVLLSGNYAREYPEKAAPVSTENGVSPVRAHNHPGRKPRRRRLAARLRRHSGPAAWMRETKPVTSGHGVSRSRCAPPGLGPLFRPASTADFRVWKQLRLDLDQSPSHVGLV